MSQWKMNSADFRRLLEDVQDYRCAITGLPLLPENVEIAHKNPKANRQLSSATSVYLVHKSIIKLAREFDKMEIMILAKLILEQKHHATSRIAEWNGTLSQATRLKIQHFNESNARPNPKSIKKRQMTWGQAYAKALKKFSGR